MHKLYLFLITSLTITVGSPILSWADCDDGIADTGETCEDSDIAANDGCSVSCDFEWICNGSTDITPVSSTDTGLPPPLLTSLSRDETHDGITANGGDQGYAPNATITTPVTVSYTLAASSNVDAFHLWNDAGTNLGDGIENFDIILRDSGGTALLTQSFTATDSFGQQTFSFVVPVFDVASFDLVIQSTHLTGIALGSWTEVALRSLTECCGDGTVDTGEACDDGNVTTGDGCDNLCVVEAGFTCSGEPSVCANTCGNSLLDGSETCDDSNTASGDGCDGNCAIETGWTCDNVPLPSTCTFSGAGCSAANLVTNADLELGTANWNDGGNPTPDIRAETNFGGTIGANNVGELDMGTDDLDQTISGMFIGQTYTISLDASPRTAGGGGPNVLCAGGDVATADVTLTGTGLGVWNAVAIPAAAGWGFQTFTTTFTATATTGLLSINSIVNNCNTIIDNVSISFSLVVGADTDADGHNDTFEACTLGTDPLDVDTDADGYCDDGVRVSVDAGFGTCAICGDGFTDMPTEECDDNNTTNGDGCTSCAEDLTASCVEPLLVPDGTSVCTFPATYARIASVSRNKSGAIEIEGLFSKDVVEIAVVSKHASSESAEWVPTIHSMATNLRYNLSAPEGDEFFLVEKYSDGSKHVDGPYFYSSLKQRVDEFSVSIDNINLQKISRAHQNWRSHVYDAPSNAPVNHLVASIGEAGVQALSYNHLATMSQKTSSFWQDSCSSGTLGISTIGKRFPVHCGGNALYFYMESNDPVFDTHQQVVIQAFDTFEPLVASAVLPASQNTQPPTIRSTHRMERDLFAAPTAEPHPLKDIYFWGVLSPDHASTSQLELASDISLSLVGERTLTLNGLASGEGPFQFEVFAGPQQLGEIAIENEGPFSRNMTIQAGESLNLNGLELVAGQGIVFVDSWSIESGESTGASAVIIEEEGAWPNELGPVLWDVTNGADLLHFDAASNSEGQLITGRKYARLSQSPLGLRPALTHALGSYSDTIVLYPNELKSVAERYQALRSEHQITLWSMESLFDTYSKGERHPESLIRALDKAKQVWGRSPRQIVLFGDGHLDYRNVENEKTNLIPPRLQKTGYGLYPWDGLQGIIVGRIPVSNIDEANRYLDKLKAYDVNRVFDLDRLVLSGEGDIPFDAQAQKFVDGSDAMDWIHESNDVNPLNHLSKMHIAEVFYSGHAGLLTLGKNPWLSPSDLPDFVAPIWVAATCLVNTYSMPSTFEGFGETLLRQENGGALVVLAPAAPLDSKSNFKSLDEWSVDTSSKTVADKLRKLPIAQQMFTLLGDPLLPLPQKSEQSNSPEVEDESLDDDGRGGCSSLPLSSPWGFLCVVLLALRRRRLVSN